MAFVADFMWGEYGDTQARVAYYMNLFSQVRIRRVNFEYQWHETAALCWPEYMNTFAFGHENAPGLKRTQFQLDSSAAIASHRFAAIVDYLMTPTHMMWSKITTDNKDLLKDRSVREWYSDVTRALWCERYKPEANFVGQNQQNLQSLGVFGNMGMFTQELDIRNFPNKKGLSYRSGYVGEIYVLQDYQGRVNGYIRHFRRDAQQAYQQFGANIPPVIQAALQKNSKTLYNFLEFVHANTDWMPWETLTYKSKPFTSCYLSVEGYCIIEEGGYRTFPLSYGRYQQAPEEEYGRGPAQMVLPALKSLNAMKGMYLKQGSLAADPAYFLGDDGMVDPAAHSGAWNYGGFDANGKFLVEMLPTGKIEATREMMQDENVAVNDAFLVTLYKDLLDQARNGSGGQKSAREVIEDAVNRDIFLAPVLGRQACEYLGPIIDRELDILSWLGKLPSMPPALKEARGEYKTVYTSPGARSMHGQEISGAMQTIEFMSNVAQQTGQPEIMDIFEYDEIARDIGEAKNMRERWFATPQKRSQKAQSRAQAAEREQRAKEKPADAAIIKAQAVMAKAQTGGNIGGVLSGTPQSGMPGMPGSPGLPGQPGVGGGPGRQGVPGQAGGY